MRMEDVTVKQKRTRHEPTKLPLHLGPSAREYPLNIAAGASSPLLTGTTRCKPDALE